MKVAALILDYDLHDLTNRVVDDLLLQDRTGINLAVMVIDNGSVEPWPSRKDSLKYPVALLRLSKNTFFPGGFNNGIAVLGDDSGFDAYWLLSNDIRLPDRRTLVTLADDLQKAPKAAMVSPCLTLDRKRPGANVGFMVTGAGRGIKAMHWVEWQAPLILSSAWQKVGSLDENFPFWGMEMDWCYRARQVKYQILIDYSVVIQHEHDTTFNAHPEMKKEFNLEKLNELFFKGMRKKWGAGWYSKLWPTNADGLRHYEREHYG